MTGTRHLDVHDMVRELVETHTHREHYQVRRGSTWFGFDHQTRVPSLVTQLQHASPTLGSERNNAGFGSRPAAHLEALDCLIHIDHEAARWLRTLGEDDDDDTERVIRRVYALTRTAPPETRRAAERDIRRWWTQARITTGWDSPAWRPDNTCPLCDKRGGLRVKLVDRSGFCTECRETWTPDTIALLADHIRAENREDEAS